MTLRDDIHAAVDEIAPPAPALAGQVVASIAPVAKGVGSVPRGRNPWLVGLGRTGSLVAALLVVLLMASLVVGVHVWRDRNAPAPVNNPHAAPGNSLRPIDGGWFFSADDGAVQLQPPNGPYPASEPGILITHDGGRTWLPTTVNSPLVNLRWLDSQHMVAVVNNVGPPWLVETTSDGGNNWRSTVAVPITAPLASLMNLSFAFFLNAHEGWALCTAQVPCTVCRWDDTACLANQQQNWIYHTVDSGAHWQQLGKSFTSTQAIPWDLVFVDSKRGFMGVSNTDNGPSLFVTNDGGKTWRLVSLPPPPGGRQPGADHIGLPVVFGNQGVVLDDNGRGDYYTYTTSDGGLTWGNPRLLPVRDLQNRYPSLGVGDPNNWSVVDGGGGLYQTTDGGKTWQQLHPTLPSGYTLDSVTPVGGNVLWGTARTADGPYFPVRSVDGGATWSIVKLPAA